MILVYAGRRIDPDDPATAKRFPLESVPRVAQEVERVLDQLQPTTVIGSAACGSDLLVLEAAGQRRMRRRVILPFDRMLFRTTSVVDRPGDWGPRFDAVIEDLSGSRDLVELALDPNDAGTYQHANAQIFREAESLARMAHEHCGTLVLWNGATRGSGDVTEAFLTEAHRRRWLVAEIDTLKSAEAKTVQEDRWQLRTN
jgi:hypothetical protein